MTTVGFRVVLHLGFGEVGWFWPKLVDFCQFSGFLTVLRAPWPDSDNFWICWGSKVIFSKNIFLDSFCGGLRAPSKPFFSVARPDFGHFSAFFLACQKNRGSRWYLRTENHKIARAFDGFTYGLGTYQKSARSEHLPALQPIPPEVGWFFWRQNRFSLCFTSILVHFGEISPRGGRYRLEASFRNIWAW